MMRKTLAYELHNTKIDEEGRFILLELTIGDRRFILASMVRMMIVLISLIMFLRN
jgi:hypothetical protein